MQTFDEAVHGDLDHVSFAVAAHAPLAILDPALRREVGRFGDVETGVETAVVAHWKCDHEFALFLHNLERNNI